MKRLIFILLQAALITLPVISFSQAFEGLYDVDSSINEGWDIFLKPDNSYFIIGFMQDSSGKLHLSDMHVAADGSQELSNHVFRLGNTTAYTYVGDGGAAKQLSGGGYLSPTTLQQFPLTGGILRSLAGLVKLDALGDTIFVRFYNDTSVYFADAYASAVMPDGGYLLGGTRNFNPDSSGSFSQYDSLMLVRTDSNGNMLWEKQYKSSLHIGVGFNSLDTLSNGRILAGVSSNFDYTMGSVGTFDYANPWFMILDSVGNILKDTVFDGTFYVGGGAIFKDLNGGYYHYGGLNEPIASNDNYGHVFFPYYVAHLDTNFSIDWLTSFPYSSYFGDRIPVVVRQTQDSGYIIAGDIQLPYIGWYRAWGAKVDKHGSLVWQHTYISDSLGDSYFNDVRERPDGSFIFCGYAHSDTLPSWHQFYDAWLVSVDSNGCLQPGCGPDTTDSSLVVPVIPPKGEVLVYPNPTHGSLTIKSSQSGNFYLLTMLGQQMGQYSVTAGQTEIILPKDMSAGVYMGSFKPDDRSPGTEVRIVLENSY